MPRPRSAREDPSHHKPFPAAPSPLRSKSSFPAVNTPVLRRARHNSENQPPETAFNVKANSPFSEVNSPAPHVIKSAVCKGKIHGSLSLPPRPLPPRSSPAANSSRIGHDPAQASVKRRLNLESSASEEASFPSSDNDTGVKVIVRMRPCNSKERLEDVTEIVEKISDSSLCIADQQFTFDHVAGTESSQQAMFEVVGQPLVENCLQGFNSSIFAYGQTGSGKTYTMWGSMQELFSPRPSEDRGLTPRVFERLFKRIKEEELKNVDKQLRYQCRCSFLEIYNEQITDLLEPLQKNLQVREDTKVGVYVENLTEEFVTNVEDVFRIMLKGLNNRRVASTSMNLESSRSHTLFMCLIESRCKSMADGVSSIRSSRMNLVDLAGSERQKLTGAAGDRLKEAGNINRSLSQLGNLINILAEISQTGRARHIPYRDSRLTFLMQDSLGGNAKLAMICAISPSSSCKSETLSTLRFAQRAKSIQNKAVINEETENDVKLLREQIRQLKDELMRMKSNETPSEAAGIYSTCWNARRSYNLLRMSLSRPLTLPHSDTDTDEEMEIDEDAVEDYDSQKQVSVSNSENTSPREASDTVPTSTLSPKKEMSEELPALNCISPSIENLQGPILSVSPRLQSCFRQSFSAAKTSMEISDVGVHHNEENFEELNRSLHHTDCPADVEEPDFCFDSPKFNPKPAQTLRASMTNIRSSLQRIKNLSSPTDRLAESLNHGLQVIANIRKVTDGSSSSVAEFSFGKCESDGEVMTDEMNLQTSAVEQSSMFPITNLNYAEETKQEVTESSPHSHLVQMNTTVAQDTCSGSPVRSSFSLRQLHSPQNIATNRMEPESMQSLLTSEQVATSFCESIETTPPLVEDASLAFQAAPMCSPERTAVSASDAQTLNEQSFQTIENSPSVLSTEKLNITENQEQDLQEIAAAALRRERSMEENLNRKIAEINQLNRLVDQYKQERECNAALQQSREGKIARLERLMEGIIPTDVFLTEEWSSMINERKIIQEKYDNHSEVTSSKISQQRLSEELEQYRRFYEQGERETLMSEVSQLRNHLQSYFVSDNSLPAKWRTPHRKLNVSVEDNECSKPSSNVSDAAECEACKEGKQRWMEQEEDWMSLVDELRSEIQEYKQQAAKRKRELEGQQRCADEMKETLKVAMEGHARLLDQYAELQEKHISLLAKHRKTREAISDARKKSGKMGFLGAKWVEAQAAELSALKLEQEEERRAAREQIESLQAQVRDTADAVQAAGELLVRLKEAEETALIAQDAAALAAEDVEKLCREMEKMKRRHATEIATLQQRLLEARFQKSKVCPMCLMAERVKFEFSGVEEETDDVGVESHMEDGRILLLD